MKIARKVFCFIIIFISLFLLLDHIFYDKTNTSQVWEMIQDPKGKEFDILFIGSSHAYVNINPLIINEALDINTALLSSSSQPMDLAYADLKTLLQYKKPKVIVFEALTVTCLAKDICFSGKEGFLYNDMDAVKNPFYRGRMVIEVLNYERWLEGFSQLFRPMLVWKRVTNLTNPNKSYRNKKYEAILGFEPRAGTFTSGIKAKIKLDQLERENISKQNENTSISEFEQKYKTNLEYLHKFLHLTDKENIPVFIIKAPVPREGYVELMRVIEKISQQHKSVKGVYNYNTQLTAIGLKIEDFFDGGHLNRVGAGKFTVYLTNKIGARLHKNPDYNKVCYYKDEAVEPLPNGLYRYRVESFPNSLVEFIVKDQKGKMIKKMPYSKNDYIDMERISYSNVLYFNLRPNTYYDNTISPQEWDFKFMKDQGILQDYSLQYLDIKREGNRINIVNNYQEVPVKYSYLVYRNGQLIMQQPYSDNNTFKFKFSSYGKFEIKAYVRTIGKNYDLKSVKIVL